MASGVLILSKSIDGNGEVKENPLNEGKLGLREVIENSGVVEFWLHGQGKWVVCFR